MKAYLHTQEKTAAQGNDPFHGHEIRLTVGMIVKNEEKNLGKCLEALKPLLDAVPSELIITDTGSTDRTVEIARQYTDHILHYEWNDDFSAARNTGLDEARGEWFLYLDGDEWFQNVSPLIDFFNSGECGRYESAILAIRNYTNPQGTEYYDTYPGRLLRLYPGVRFEHAIHEDITRRTPVKMLNAVLDHYGYAFSRPEDKERHDLRNRKMLEKMLEKDPDDLKALFQLSRQLVGTDNGKSLAYAERGVEVSRRLDGDRTHCYSRMQNSRLNALLHVGDDEKLLDAVPDALSRENEPGLFHLEIYWMGQQAAYRLKKYPETVEMGNSYLKVYEAYREGKLDLTLRMFDFFDHGSQTSCNEVLLLNGMAYLALDETEQVKKCLEKIDLSLPDSPSNGPLTLCFSLADRLDDWSAAVRLYNRLPRGKKQQEFIAFADQYGFGYPSKGEALTRAFAKAEGNDTWFLLCRLRLAESEGDRKQAVAVLDSLRRSEGLWDSGYADILWYVMKERVNFLPFLSHADVDGFPAMTAAMQTAHEDYSAVIGNYSETFSFENAKALFCSACLLERAVLSRDAQEKKDLYPKLIRSYFESLSKFVRAVYKPEILTAAGLSALPRPYRFGYYAGLALDAENRGDAAAYLADLNAGLKEYPAMKDCVGFLLKDFEDRQKKSDAQAREFAALAAQAKRNIEQLIAQGDLKQAGVYTLQLAKLIPEDDDLRRYRRLTHTEPTMGELVTRLPQ